MKLKKIIICILGTTLLVTGCGNKSTDTFEKTSGETNTKNYISEEKLINFNIHSLNSLPTFAINSDTESYANFRQMVNDKYIFESPQSMFDYPIYHH